MRMPYKKIPKYFSLLLLMGLLIACSTEKLSNVDQKNIVWPSAPANAKIKLVRTFSKPSDLGIERGFWQWLSDLFTGEENFRLIRPMSVVVTNKQQIYVADPGAKGVHRFDMREKEYKLITRQDELILPSPVALSLGPDDSVYVVDSELAQVFRIDPLANDAERILPSLTFQQPTGIAYSPATQRIYISDTARHQIMILGQGGRLLKTFGQRGSEKAEFNFPTYLWVDKGDRLFVTDSLNFRIQIFDRAGNYLSNFGKHGNGSGDFSRPKGVAVDKNGHILVVDALFNAIQIFNEKGALLLPVGSRGHMPGQFWLPADIFLNNNDEIYVADSHNQRVQVLSYVGVIK